LMAYCTCSYEASTAQSANHQLTTCQARSKKSGFSYPDFYFFGSLRKGQWRLSIHLFHDNYH